MPSCKHTPLIFELESRSRAGTYIQPSDVPRPDFAEWFGKDYRSAKPGIPDVDEISVVRHYTNLSTKNYHVEMGPYPLGSCTMKYNPKVNEDMAALTGFAATHPLQPDKRSRGIWSCSMIWKNCSTTSRAWMPTPSSRQRAPTVN